jgi:hypothetical protein
MASGGLLYDRLVTLDQYRWRKSKPLKFWLTLCAGLPVIAVGVVGVLCKWGSLDRAGANRWAGAIATVASVFALAFGCVTFGDEPSATRYSTKMKAGLLILWTLLPPVCFLFEYLLFKPTVSTVLEELKYEQDLKSKVWLALVTVLTTLYFGKDILKR